MLVKMNKNSANRIIIAITTIILLLNGCGQDASTMNKEKEAAIKNEVNQAFEGLVDAAKSLDTDRYLGFFDKVNFTSLNEDGTVTHSFDLFAESFREQFGTVAGYNSLEFKNVKVTVLGQDSAILVNEYDANVNLKSGSSMAVAGGGTQVWSKTTGSWKLVNVSSSSRPVKLAE